MIFYEHEKKERNEFFGPRPKMPAQASGRIFTRMEKYLEERRLSYQVAVENGWYPTDEIDHFSRIVIPCTNPSGAVYYQARAMNDNAKIRYMSPAATREDSVVYVGPSAKYAAGGVIVEGPMDALAAAGCGWIGIGLMGNVPGPGVIAYVAALIKHLKRVLVVPDADAMEMGGYVIGALAMHHVAVTIRPVTKGKDFAELSPRQRLELLK